MPLRVDLGCCKSHRERERERETYFFEKEAPHKTFLSLNDDRIQSLYGDCSVVACIVWKKRVVSVCDSHYRGSQSEERTIHAEQTLQHTCFLNNRWLCVIHCFLSENQQMFLRSIKCANDNYIFVHIHTESTWLSLSNEYQQRNKKHEYDYSLYIAYIVWTISIIFVVIFLPQVKQNHIPLSNVLANHSQGKHIQF